jgi:hypothetical protein
VGPAPPGAEVMGPDLSAEVGAAALSTRAAGASAAPAGLTCSTVAPDITQAVNDLKASDQHYQEAWVTGGFGSDLQTLITDTNEAAGSSQLDQDASTFNSDATTYLSGNGSALAPGWQTGYGQVTADIDAMATDCGLAVAKPNTPANS